MSADLWNNDEVQFARLIAEMEAFGVFEGMDNWHGLFESMDLDEEAICEIIDRAQVSFEKTCAELQGMPLPPLAVGDPVKVNVPDHGYVDGKEGVITELPELGSSLYLVTHSAGTAWLYDFELIRL